MKSIRRFAIPVLALVALAMVTSCKSDRAWARGVKTAWDVVGPEYRTYVENDPNLSETSRAIRLNTATEMDKTLEVALDGQ